MNGLPIAAAAAAGAVVVGAAAAGRPVGERGRRAARSATRGWLDTVERGLGGVLERADVGTAPTTVARIWGGATAALGTAALLAAGPVAAAAAVAAAAVTPLVGARALGDRASRRVEHELPGVLDEVARAVRAGAPAPEALAAAGLRLGDPLAVEIETVVAEVQRGVTLVDALDRWAARRPLVGVRLAAAAVAVSAAAGGSPARALDGVAATLRERAHAAAELRALATQARLSAAVIAVAPIAFAVFTAGLDAGAAGFLLGTVPGRACLVAGLALDAAGAAWMVRLTQVEP